VRSAPRSEKLRPDRHRLHPLFDGYAAAENRGTLALAYALNPAHSPGLLSSFSHAFLERVFPVRRGDRVEARLQLVLSSRSRGAKAIPDAAFVNHSQKCLLLIESKVETGTLDIVQLRRHLVNAKRHYPGYRRVLLLVSPDPADTSARRVNQLRRQPEVRILAVRWFDIYEWAWKHLRRAARGHRSSATPTFLTRELIEFLRGRDWMGFQGFPADWPEEYRISEAREHLKALREHFRDQLRRQGRGWPSGLLPTGKKLTQAWFPLGDGQVHLTVYAWQDWTGVDLYVPRSIARRRLKSDEDWKTFLHRVRSLPDRERVWVRASRWRLMNWTQGRQTGPKFDSIDLSIRAEDLLQRSNGKVLRDALRGLACDANTKALFVEYRHYFLDARLQKQLRAREFADRLLRSAKHLLDLYRWFGGTARRRLR
jgi:hypothetical protein